LPVTTLSEPSTQARPGLDALLDLLDLEQVEVDLFRSRDLGEPGYRLFGGQVAAQAMVAAERTIAVADAEARTRPHSLHAYFLRPGDTGKRVVYRVDRLHDGRTFQRRRVTAIQDGAVILALESSFTTDLSLADRQPPAPAVPDPEACPPLDETVLGTRLQLVDAFEFRTVPGALNEPTPLVRDLWFRARGNRTDGRASGSAVLTYISDLTLVLALLRGSGPLEGYRLTSMDHALWFHHEIALDDWLLYAKQTVAAGPLRGLVQGSIFRRDGTLVATVMQEGLIHANG
jgi:acyl-CoA thioesterase-2